MQVEHRSRWLLVAVLLTAALGVSAASVLPLRAEPSLDDDGRLILAFYYAWYDWDVWTTQLCDQPTQLYVSADVTAIERHVGEAQRAGIDALILAWYGPDLTGNPTEPNLTVLLDKAAKAGVGIAVMLDMTSSHLASMDDVAAAMDAVGATRSAHPGYLHAGGRPVVFFLGQDRFSLAAWEALRNNTDPGGGMLWVAQRPSSGADDWLAVFDGLFLYSLEDGVLSAMEVARAANEVHAWSAAHRTPRVWMATVLPGYDDFSLVGQEEPTVYARDEGDAYREDWRLAASTDPDWIGIRSYNGWPACTQIESSTAYGGTYVDLTADLAAQYRVPAVPTVAPTETVVPPSPTPTATLVPGTVAPTATVVATPTPVLTPTATVTPTATPFRLATPTPVATLVPMPNPGAPTGTPRPGDPTAAATPVRPGDVPTPTPMSRLPVEGEAPRRCAVLPALLPLLAAAILRRRP